MKLVSLEPKKESRRKMNKFSFDYKSYRQEYCPLPSQKLEELKTSIFSFMDEVMFYLLTLFLDILRPLSG